MLSVAAKIWEVTEEFCAFFDVHRAHNHECRVLFPSRYCKRQFIEFYDRSLRNSILIVGMNPGPHGMGQTGCAFTDIPTVRAIIGKAIETRPEEQSPISVGRWTFDRGKGNRTEESASRLWPACVDALGQFASICKADSDAYAVTARHFTMINACPVLWLALNGTNVSAEDKQKRVVLESEHLARLYLYLQQIHDILKPSIVVGVGNWADKQCHSAFLGHTKTPRIKMLHPSPIAGSEEKWRKAAMPILHRALTQHYAT